MVKDEFFRRISRYAVRIAKNDYKSLKGSGVLFLRQLGEQPILFTAAHVVYSLFEDSDDARLCMGFTDGHGGVQTMELNVCLGNRKKEETCAVGNVYIHPKYLESEEVRADCSYDAALIILPWQKWMETCDSFFIKDGAEGQELRGWGFPQSMDKEMEKESADILAGKKEIHGFINHIEKTAKRFSFAYNLGHMERNVTRDSAVVGFSGSGLFDVEEDGIVLKGIISKECGGKTAGQMLWASSSGLFFDLMQEYRITLQCPQSFEPYMNIIAASFPKTRQIAKTCFIDWSEELMEDHGVLPRDFECDTQIKLQCNSNRKYCTMFWTGQLKKAVILYGVSGIPANQLASAYLKMPAPYQEDCVYMKFICTEQQIERVLGELIEKDYFSEKDSLDNGTIFVLNNNINNRDSFEIYPRSECREIVCNIAGEYPSSKNLKRKIQNLLEDKDMKNKFDIIKGVNSQCNLAAVGVEKLMEILYKRNIDLGVMKQKMEDLLTEIWEI